VDYLNKSNNDDFNLLYKTLNPLSYYGKRFKKEFKPFITEQHHKAILHYNLLSKIVKCERENKDDFAFIRSKLENILNIDEYLANLENKELENTNFYQLRKFLINSISILKKINEQIPQTVNKSCIYDLEKLINIFDRFCDYQLGFHISSNKFAKLLETKEEMNQIAQAKKNLLESRKKKISDLLNRPIDDKFQVTSNKHNLDFLKRVDYLSIFEKQDDTFVFEFIKDEKVIKYEKDIDKLKEKYLLQEDKIKSELLNEINPHFSKIREIIKLIGEIDLLLAKSDLLIIENMSIPEISKDQLIEIKDAYNPIIKNRLSKNGQDFTPRNISLSKGIVAITGINMGGKTVTLRLINLVAKLVSYGMPVPARSCRCSLFDFIYFKTKDNNKVESGLSLFASEIKDIQFVIANKNKKGLIILDEIASGANPEVGKSVVLSFIEEIKDTELIVIFTTHYNGLNEYEYIQKWKTKGIKAEINSLKNVDIENISRMIDYSLIKDTNDYSMEEILKVIKALGLNESVLNSIRKKLN